MQVTSGSWPETSHEMCQEEGVEDEVEISIDGAILTTEAELRAWYLATNPMLRSVGLSCPATLFREMQRDLRNFDARWLSFQSPKTWTRPWLNVCSTSLLLLAKQNQTSTQFVFVKCVPMSMCSLQLLTVMANADRFAP